VNVTVDTVSGVFAVDLETEEIEPANGLSAQVEPAVSLPRLVASASAGSTVVAVVDASPPMLVSYDAGITWRESGRGLPRGRAVAIGDDDPDLIVYASRNRLHLSRDGGRFWTTLAVELPEIRRVAF
jgi:hypothetical protein